MDRTPGESSGSPASQTTPVRLGVKPGRLVREHAPRVYALALEAVGDEAEAENVTEEVLRAAAGRLGTFPDDPALAAWLSRATADAVRMRAGRPGGAGAASAPPQGGGLSRRLGEAMHALPTPLREVLELIDGEGLSDAEAGARLGLSPAALHGHLRRARDCLRQALAPYYR